VIAAEARLTAPSRSVYGSLEHTMACLGLKLFGGFQLRLESRTLALPARKAQKLLAYLALRPGRSHARQTLTALLWGDTPDKQARQSLRQTVLQLRRVFAAARNRGFVVQGETIAVDAAAVDVDVARFERLLRQGTREALEAAAALYQGPLLEGLRLEAGPFEDWLQSERERLRESALEALTRLLDLQMERGPLDTAVQTAGRLLALDPLREDVHRTLMWLYLRQGRRGAALRHYQVCVGVLERELGVEPDAETQRVYREILQQQARRVGGARQGVTVALTPLVGRHAEMTRLRALLNETVAGRGRVALVTGEAGIGKSRLVEELVAEHARREGRVLVGRAYETEQILPLRPWIDALRTGRVLAEAGREGDLHPGARRELARLFPELAEPGVTPEITRESYVRLFELIDGLIARLAGRQPVMLVVEDLHCADDMSLRLLAFLARRTTSRPVLIVGTARDEEMAYAPALRQVCEELDPAVDRVSLAPLSEADTARLVRALARTGGQDTRVARLAERVWALSEGNPFVIVETMRVVQDHRAFDSPGVSLPERVRAMTLARVERLGAKARQLVAMAAVIEREFSFAVLQSASGLSRRDTAEGLEELIRRRVLQTTGERFDFAHARIRNVVYDSLLAPRRAALHAAVGEALETAYAGRHHEVYDRLAYHFSRADDAPKTFEYLLGLADKAARSYALEEAVRLFADARSYVDRLPAETRDRRCLELVFGLVQGLTPLGRTREAYALLDEQGARVERLGDPALIGLHLFWVAYLRGTFGENDAAAATARRALEEAARAGDEATMGKANMVLACESYILGRALEGIAHGRQAVALLERSGERWWLAQGHRWLAWNLLHLGEFPAALASVEQVCAIGEALGDTSLQALGAHSLCRVRAVMGEHAAAVASGRRAVEIAPDPVSRAYALGHLGTAYVEGGDVNEAIATIEESVAQLQRLSARGFRRQIDGFLIAHLSEAYLLKGDVDKAGELAEEALHVSTEGKWSVAMAYAERARGLAARARGALSEALEHLGRALELFASVDTRFQVARMRLLLAEVRHAAGDAETASSHLQAALETFRRLRVPRFVERAEGVAAAIGIELA
jgi:DNA-binding SARP family transcriptional activator